MTAPATAVSPVAAAASARNRIAVVGDQAFMALPGGRIVLLDAGVVAKVAPFNWMKGGGRNPTAVRAVTGRIRTRRVESLLHKFLTDATKFQQVEFLNADRDDFRLANLRVVDRRVPRRTPFLPVHGLPGVAARNPVKIVDGVALMELPTGETVLLDLRDVALVGEWRWTRQVNPRTTYARTVIGGRTVGMHRFLLGLQDEHREPGGKCVDHINHNGLDNRRANLRVGDYVRNGQNRRPNRGTACGFKGVTRSGSRWAAHITVEGRDMLLGTYETAEAAAAAYDAAACEHFGVFALTNGGACRG